MANDLFEQAVFARRETDQTIISDGSYNFVIGGVLLWGFLVNGLIVNFVPAEAILQVNFWIFFIGFFASSFFGVWLFNSSEKPIASFIGYNFVVMPFGLIIDVAVSRFDPEIAKAALEITGLVTLLMMVAGTLWPQVFRKMAGALLAALAAMIIVEAVEVFVLGIHHGAIDWVIAFIFSGYVAFDWGRANQIPKTIDNAVDSAAALYIDIVNLFLRILDILGRIKKGGRR